MKNKQYFIEDAAEYIKVKDYKNALKKYIDGSCLLGWKFFWANIIYCKKNIYKNISMPKISVVIPVYNSEKFLHECINSLVNQSLEEVEFIFVDDGSTDNSLDILIKTTITDPRVKVIYQNNRSAGAARNHGLKYCTGEYIIFLDSDDFFDRDLLYYAYQKAVQTGSDIVVFKANEYNERTKEIKIANFALNSELFPSKDIFNFRDFKGLFFQAISTSPWNKLIKKSLIDHYNLRFQEIKACNDILFIYSALVFADKISLLDQILVTYRTGNSKSLQRTKHLTWECLFLAFCALKDTLVHNNIYKNIQQSFANKVLHSIIYYCNTVDVHTKNIILSSLQNKYARILDINIDNESYYFDKRELTFLKNVFLCNYIPIVYACDKGYINITYISIKSIIDNSDKKTILIFFILHDSSVQEKEKEILRSLENSNTYINFIDMTGKFEDLKSNIKHVTRATFYRLEIVKLLSFYKKVIYLDGDTVVKSNINRLYRTDINNFYIAGAKAIAYDHERTRRRLGIDPSSYVNAGVLLFNIEELNKFNIYERFIQLSKKNFLAGDQDILNVACHGKIKLIDKAFNFMTKYINTEGYCIQDHEINIIHYADKIKPWNDKNSPYASYFWKIAMNSPFSF